MLHFVKTHLIKMERNHIQKGKPNKLSADSSQFDILSREYEPHLKPL